STAAGWRKEYPIGDHLGSTRIVLSPDVVPILSRTDYEPFGRPLQTQSPANPQRLSWIGKENDGESSLGDFGARKYDPELGRFTSVDPLWEEMPGSNPFHYCFNNPVMMRDPFGLEPDGFKNQLTDLEWHNSGVEKEEASPLKKGSEYSESVKKEIIRANKIAWNLQMRDRDAADISNSSLTLDIAGGIYGGLQGLTSSQGYWLGKNGKYYSNSWGGNQYTGGRFGAFKAASNYKLAGKATLMGSVVLGGYKSLEGYVADGRQFGYNAQMAAVSSAGSVAGGWAGAEAGALIGAEIGVCFGGVGAIPGAVIGGVIGGFGFGMARGYYGGQLGESVVKYFHGR
ncbi:MAG: RHS repeat domain-containing protein, partial [Candidatus Kapaibacterium sp.]